MEKLYNKKAFTFVESMVVVAIIGICMSIWGFYGRGRAKSETTEAKMFIDKIVAQEKIYYADYGSFISVNDGSIDKKVVSRFPALLLSAEGNSYFKRFRVSVNNNGLSIELFKDEKDNFASFRGNFVKTTDVISYNI